MSCPTFCDFSPNLKVIKALLKDCAIVSSTRNLTINYTVENYDALKDLVNSLLLALGTPNKRVVFFKQDGKYMFDNQKTFAESQLVENHNTRFETVLAWNWRFGIIGPKSVPKYWQHNYEKDGYSIASRTSSTTGLPSFYVAKVCSKCAGTTDPQSFTARVS